MVVRNLSRLVENQTTDYDKLSDATFGGRGHISVYISVLIYKTRYYHFKTVNFRSIPYTVNWIPPSRYLNFQSFGPVGSMTFSILRNLFSKRFFRSRTFLYGPYERFWKRRTSVFAPLRTNIKVRLSGISDIILLFGPLIVNNKVHDYNKYNLVFSTYNYFEIWKYSW